MRSVQHLSRKKGSPQKSKCSPVIVIAAHRAHAQPSSISSPKLEPRMTYNVLLLSSYRYGRNSTSSCRSMRQPATVVDLNSSALVRPRLARETLETRRWLWGRIGHSTYQLVTVEEKMLHIELLRCIFRKRFQGTPGDRCTSP